MITDTYPCIAQVRLVVIGTCSCLAKGVLAHPWHDVKLYIGVILYTCMARTCGLCQTLKPISIVVRLRTLALSKLHNKGSLMHRNFHLDTLIAQVSLKSYRKGIKEFDASKEVYTSVLIWILTWKLAIMSKKPLSTLFILLFRSQLYYISCIINVHNDITNSQ